MIIKNPHNKISKKTIGNKWNNRVTSFKGLWYNYVLKMKSNISNFSYFN